MISAKIPTGHINYLNSLSKNLEYFIRKWVPINVHNLLHLRECVNTFGSINSFSAYPFENYIHRISRLVRGKKLVIQQISNRVAE